MNKFYFISVIALMLIFSPVLSHAQENDNALTQKKAGLDKGDIVCPQDAKLCPDGSFVTRESDHNCQFEKCSGEEAKQEKNKEFKQEKKEASSTESDSKESAEKVEKTSKSDKGESDDSVGCVGDNGETNCLAPADNPRNENDAFEKRSEQRKSQMGKAIQELVSVAKKVKTTVGEKIKTIAQEQEKNYQDAEEAVKVVSKRGTFAKFFIGPNYSEINKAEKYAEQYTEKLKEMQNTVTKITAPDVVNILDAQIQKMQQVKNELEKEINKQKGGFSLFGWLNKLFAK